MSQHRVPLDLCMDPHRYTDKESAMFTAGYEFAVLIQELSAFAGSNLYRMGWRVSHENRMRAEAAVASMNLDREMEDLGPHYWLIVKKKKPAPPAIAGCVH